MNAKLRTLLLVAVLLLFAPLDAIADWEKTFGGADDDWGYCVQHTSDGGFVIAGGTRSSGAGGYDIWLIKTDATGDERWSKTFGGTGDDKGYAVQQTTDGGFILGGFTDSFGAGGQDIWLIKTDASGNSEWDKTFGSLGNEQSYALAQTTDGGYIIAGIKWPDAGGFSDVWLIKTDGSGNEQWNRTFGGAGDDQSFGVKQTSDGGYVIAGFTASTGAGGKDVWLLKTDSDGIEEWNKTFGGTEDDRAYGVCQTTDGGYAISGHTYSFGSGGMDSYLIKTDLNGNMQWQQTFGGLGEDETRDIQQTADNGFLIAGQTDSSGMGSYDAWLIKTDDSGNEKWNKTFGGTGREYGYGFDQVSDGEYVVIGRTWSFGAGASDAWFVKSSTTYFVPDDFQTIQEALNSVSDGDLVIVRDGTYESFDRGLDFRGKAITLRSENGPEDCIITGQGVGRGFRFHSGETPDSVLSGFTITYCKASGDYPDNCGGGIRCEYGSSPTITDCIISHSSAEYHGGGISCSESSPNIANCIISVNNAGGASIGAGISCRFNSSPTIADCTIIGNSGNGQGIGCYSYSSPTIIDCYVGGNSGVGIFCHYHASPRISDCTVSGNQGGGVYLNTSSAIIKNSSIISNFSVYQGGGITFDSGCSAAIITDSTIEGNVTNTKGGGFLISNNAPSISNCKIIGNSAGNCGGGVYFSESSPDLLNCTISENWAGRAGGGIYCHYESAPNIYNCTMTQNSAVDWGGAGIACNGSSPSMLNCILWDDVAPRGAEILLVGSSNLYVGFSDVKGGKMAAYVGTGSSLIWENGNIDKAPLFVGERDYHLTAMSPCIDGGIDTGVYSDIDGDMRPYGFGYDIGSDEYVAFNNIALSSPPNESVLYSAPAFTWTPNGGTDNVFAVDFSFSYPITTYFSTYENMGQLISGNNWTPSSAIWNRIPSGSFVYWRVRGADLGQSPLNIIYSDEVFWFYKP